MKSAVAKIFQDKCHTDMTYPVLGSGFRTILSIAHIQYYENFCMAVLYFFISRFSIKFLLLQARS